MIKRITSGWNVVRLVRLLIGTGAAVQGIIQNEGLLIAVGMAILIGAVLQVGCCGSTGCPVPSSKKETNKQTEEKEVESAK